MMCGIAIVCGSVVLREFEALLCCLCFLFYVVRFMEAWFGSLDRVWRVTYIVLGGCRHLYTCILSFQNTCVGS